MSDTVPASLAPLTGLFLGAGASYELGMPLVWGFTNELKTWLTPDKLRDLNTSWREQGGGYPDTVIDDLSRILEQYNEMHYESILGYLETQFLRSQQHQEQAQAYHGLYSWLVEMVYYLLYFRHVKNESFIASGLRYVEGIAGLALQNTPLWVFSLNHDLMIECLAIQYGLTLNSGFSGTMTLPRRDRDGMKIGDLHAEIISGEEVEKLGMPFLQPGSLGINLLKIHGALDVFTFRDGKDLMKLQPLAANVGGVLNSLRAANEELLYIHPTVPTRPIKATNEIAYADDEGEMQFLRRSLLSGAYKFNQRFSQVLPSVFLKCFRSNINYLSTVVSIGYGFGDIHINAVLREWLEASTGRALVIVGPGTTSVPSVLLHLAPQVTMINGTATDYLEQYVLRPLTPAEIAEKARRLDAVNHTGTSRSR